MALSKFDDIGKRFNDLIEEELPQKSYTHGVNIGSAALLLDSYLRDMDDIDGKICSIIGGPCSSEYGINVADMALVKTSYPDQVQQLLSEKKRIADNCIYLGALTQAIILITQFYNSKNVCEELDKNERLAKESLKELEVIKAEIQGLKPSVEKLERFLFETIKFLEESKVKFANKFDGLNLIDSKAIILQHLRRLTNDLKNKVTRIRCSIDMVKIKTKNGIEQIGKCQKEQTVQVVANLANSLVSGAQFLAASASASVGALVLKGAMTLAHLSIVTMNKNNIDKCEDVILKMRQVLEEARQLEELILSMDNLILKAENVIAEQTVDKLPDSFRNILNEKSDPEPNIVSGSLVGKSSSLGDFETIG